jgi:predicted metalloendopeptidase
LANFLFWRIADFSKGFLSTSIRQPGLKFAEVLHGIIKLPQLWKRCVKLTKIYFIPITSAMIARIEPFHEFDKIEKIIGAIRGEMLLLIENSSKIEDSMKESLLEKLGKTEVLAQYPSEYFNDTFLEKFYEPAEVTEGKYFESILKLEHFKIQIIKERILKTVNESKWSLYFDLDEPFQASSHLPSKNIIFLHPDDLLYPSYNHLLPDFVNFAGLGARLAILYGFAINYEVNFKFMKIFKN